MHLKPFVRRTPLALIPIMVFVGLCLGPLEQSALADAGTVYSYPCAGFMRADHAAYHFPGRHVGQAVVSGVNPPYDPCLFYLGVIVTTDWQGGGTCSSVDCWYYHNNHSVESGWVQSWHDAQAIDSTYCYAVRAQARGKDGDGTYFWIMNYEGYQSDCWTY